MKPVTLADIASVLNCPAPIDGSRVIGGVATLPEAGEDDLSFVTSDAFTREVASTKAAALVVARQVKLPAVEKPLLLVDDVDLAMAQVLQLFAPPVPAPPIGVDPSARVPESAVVGADAAIGPNVAIGQRTRIGARSVLHAGVVIGDDVQIGEDCQLFANVVVRERITIGSRVIIHAGSVLGTDGFGYRWDGTQHRKIPQIGTVIVEDDVEIGSCVCIDRAKLSATVIGRGTKIDNLVQIGHNVRVGPHCIIVGQTGVAGSAELGSGVVLGGQTAVRDHVHIGDNAMAAARSAIADDIAPKSIVSGMPALPHRQSLREQAALRRLPELVVQVRKLTDELENLKKRLKS